MRHISTFLIAMMLAAVAARAALAADLIEGKWYGKAGFPQDRVDLGFEIKADDKGVLKAYLYSPVINFYGLELPGEVKPEDGRYTHKDWHMTLTLRDGRLNGTMFFNDAPFTLERTDRLPSEVPVPAFDAGPGPKWQTKLGAAIYARAAVSDGIAFVGTTGGMFFALRVGDGSYVWSFSAGRPIFGEALVTKESVFFACDNGYLYKLDRKTGKEQWHYDLGDARASRVLPHLLIENSGDFDFDVRASHPVLVGDALYVGSGDNSVHAVSASTGSRIWRFAANGKVRGDVVVDGPRLYVGAFGGMVYAIDRNTGAEVWHKETKADVTDSVALIDNRLIVGNRAGLLAALNPATGDVVWKSQLWGSAVESAAVPAKARGMFYMGSSDLRRVALIDAKDGRVVWRTDVFGWAWPRPALVGDRLYMSTFGGAPYDIRHLGALTAMDVDSGKIIWRWPMPEWQGSWLNGFAAPPTVEGHALIVGGLDGTLYNFPVP